MRASTSSTTRPRASTTCSRSSCASRGSAARAHLRLRGLPLRRRRRADVLMATAKQTLVLIDLDDRRPVPVPDAFRDPRRRRSSRDERRALEAVDRSRRRRRRRRRRPARGRRALVERAAATGPGSSSSRAASSCSAPRPATPRPEARTQRAGRLRRRPRRRARRRRLRRPALLERRRRADPAYCLVGWDTGGVPWDPDA